MLKGNINHSVCDWCYPSLSLEVCIGAKRIGLVGIDLVKPKRFSNTQKIWTYINNDRRCRDYSKVFPMTPAITVN